MQQQYLIPFSCIIKSTIHHHQGSSTNAIKVVPIQNINNKCSKYNNYSKYNKLEMRYTQFSHWAMAYPWRAVQANMKSRFTNGDSKRTPTRGCGSHPFHTSFNSGNESQQPRFLKRPCLYISSSFHLWTICKRMGYTFQRSRVPTASPTRRRGNRRKSFRHLALLEGVHAYSFIYLFIFFFQKKKKHV